ncbi:MAG: YcgN family cysteine cluster protein [Pseudomonadota bacterium]
MGRFDMDDGQPFWERKNLSEMNLAEWESLCDGCGRCCTVTIEDEDEPDLLHETSLCCRLFDPNKRRCTRYEQRTDIVPECVILTPRNVRDLGFMPDTCAYRLISEGKGLKPWHPLVSGDPKSVERAGVAVPKTLTNETLVDENDLWRHVIGTRPRG